MIGVTSASLIEVGTIPDVRDMLIIVLYWGVSCVDSICSNGVGIGSSLHADLTACRSESIVIKVGVLKVLNLHMEIVIGGSVKDGRELIIFVILLLK